MELGGCICTSKGDPSPSTPTYHQNLDCFSCAADVYACARCGKPAPAPEVYVHIGSGGDHYLKHGEENTPDPGCVGLYPLKPECARQVPREYHVPA